MEKPDDGELLDLLCWRQRRLPQRTHEPCNERPAPHASPLLVQARIVSAQTGL